MYNFPNSLDFPAVTSSNDCRRRKTVYSNVGNGVDPEWEWEECAVAQFRLTGCFKIV